MGADLRLTILAVPPVLTLIHRDLHLSEAGVGALTALPMFLLAAAAILGSLDEDQRRAVDERLQAALTPAALAEVDSRHPHLRLAVAVAAHGRSIFCELGAGQLLSSEWALRVRLAPSFESLVTHHARLHGLGPEAARAELESKEASLREAGRALYARDLDDPGEHDVVLNSATLDLFSATELLIQAFQARFHPEPGWWYRADGQNHRS